MKSRAAICIGPNLPLEIDEIDVAGPKQGEVMVEIKATGLCHSDYHQIDGSYPGAPYPAVLGHEGAGIVVDIGPGVTSVKIGDHVIPVPVPECRQCTNCTSGRTNVCKEFFSATASPFSRKGGALAQYAGLGTFSNFTTVREISVAKIREDAPMDKVCYVGCGVSTGLGSAISSAKVTFGSTVIVFGLGGIGLNVVQGAKLSGARRIIGVDISDARKPMAVSFGCTDFVNPLHIDGSIVEHLRAMTDGGSDFSFECVGNTTLMSQALEVVQPGYGVAVVVGVAPLGSELRLAPFELLLGRTIKGAILGGAKGRTDIPRYVDYYMDGNINIDDLVTHHLSLEQINEGFDLMKAGKSIRSVVIF